MVDQALESHPLAEDFAGGVVRMVASDDDLRRVGELMGGSFKSVAEAQSQEMFVVGRAGQVESAGHLGETTWAIGSTILKSARSWAGIAGESNGVPDPIFVQGYRAHFKLAKEAGCSLVLVHGSQYDHAFCGFVPCFYYPVATLPSASARSVVTSATLRGVRGEVEERAGEEALLRDAYATKMSAGDRGPIVVVEQEGGTAGYFRVDPHARVPAEITVQTREAALAVIKHAGEVAEEAGDEQVSFLQSHMTLVAQTLLSLGGKYLLRPSCDVVGLDAEMVAILDLAALFRALQGEFQDRLSSSLARDIDAGFSIEMGDMTAGFRATAGSLQIVTRKQPVHRVLPRWLVTRLVVGYYSAEDVLAMGPIPTDRSDGKTPDDPELDMVPLQLPAGEAALFKALFPKLWPCSMADPDVRPWVVGEEHPRYQFEERKTPEMKAKIDTLRFPWIGY